MIITYSKEFNKSVRRLKNKNALMALYELIEKLENAETLNDISNVKAIRNYANLYRIRVGDYRLIASHERNTIEILLLEFLKRNENTYKYI